MSQEEIKQKIEPDCDITIFNKIFKCGDEKCKKQYSTNAALYTHIKTKHDGNEPIGTQRPNFELV